MHLMRTLLAAGLDPNQPDWLGKTFLHACAENFDRSVAAVLLNAGANINARDLEFQGTPLAAAVRFEPWCAAKDKPAHEQRRLHMVQFLLQKGAATNLPNEAAWATPLAWARQRGLAEIEQTLVAHGAT